LPGGADPLTVCTGDELLTYLSNSTLCQRFATGAGKPGEPCTTGTCAAPGDSQPQCAPPIDHEDAGGPQCWLITHVAEGEACDFDPVTPVWRTCAQPTPTLPTTQAERDEVSKAYVLCDPDTLRCTRIGDIGALPGESCAVKRCVQGKCDDASKTCVLAALGRACEGSNVCDTTADCVADVCVARLADGAACEDDGPECLGTCRDHVCGPASSGNATKQRCEGLEQ
jgi:hypothetical protein